MRRASARASRLALLLTVLLPSCDSRPPDPVARNVVLIVVDTLRADRLGCYGYTRDSSPNIDQLAARGTLYEEARAQGSWTLPSMLSMMTGLYVTHEEERLPSYRATIAELASAASKKTAAFIANVTLTTDRGFDRGFDHFEHVKVHHAPAVINRFIEWYEGSDGPAKDGNGFFAWLHPDDPHSPYQPWRRHDRFADAPLPEGVSPPRLVDLLADSIDGVPVADEAMLAATEEFIQKQNNCYDGEVFAADEAIGKLMSFLRQEGILDETLVILASDHGEEMYEYPRYPERVIYAIHRLEAGETLPLSEALANGHGSHTEAVVWTPLILAGPGIPSNTRRAGLAANLDLYPTILAAFGIDEPDEGLAEGPGQSLLGGAVPKREQVFTYGHHTASVVDRRGLKLIDRRNRASNYREQYWMKGNPTGLLELELFDLSAKRGELSDVAATRPQEFDFLLNSLERWRSENSREIDREVTENDLRALREMGYLGDD